MIAKEELSDCLRETGCSLKCTERILALYDEGKHGEFLLELRKLRCVLMEDLHTQMRKVDHLDDVIMRQKKMMKGGER